MIDSFSPQMIKTYLNCPKKFYFKYMEKISVPQSALPFEKGKKIHALANYYLNGINIDKLEKTILPQDLATWNLLKTNHYYNKKFFKSEFSLMTKVDNFWISGRIDAIVQEENVYYILDYKTGSTPQNPEFDYQTMIYLLCLDKYLKNYKSLSFVYINLKDKIDYIIEFTPEMKKLYEQKIIEICKQISQDKMFKPCTKNCSNCEYSKLCL